MRTFEAKINHMAEAPAYDYLSGEAIDQVEEETLEQNDLWQLAEQALQMVETVDAHIDGEEPA